MPQAGRIVVPGEARRFALRDDWIELRPAGSVGVRPVGAFDARMVAGGDACDATGKARTGQRSLSAPQQVPFIREAVPGLGKAGQSMPNPTRRRAAQATFRTPVVSLAPVPATCRAVINAG